MGDEKIWSENKALEQIVLLVKAYLLLGPDSSSEMDPETDDQSYTPTEVYALTWHGYTTHIMQYNRAKLEHTRRWGNKTAHLSLNSSLRSYLDPARDLLRQVALSALKALFSL